MRHFRFESELGAPWFTMRDARPRKRRGFDGPLTIHLLP